MEVLCCAMGISRSSFYQAFGNKHDLLLTTLDRYGDIVLARIDEAFRPGLSFREGFTAFLLGSIACEGMTQGDAEGPRGCYLGNCAAELAATDPEAAERLGRTFTRIVDAFAREIRHAQTRGEVPADRDALALARLLAAGVQGLRLVAKTNPDRAVLADIADGLLQAAR